MTENIYVKVTGKTEQFDTGSDVSPVGERVIFPRPVGARVEFIARNPGAPNEELWSVQVDRDGHSDLSGLADFLNHPNVQQLTYKELVEVLRTYDPTLMPPPVP